MKGVAEQLKLENTTKWKLQERDDWRALSDSLRADRNRLLQENEELHRKINEYQRKEEENSTDNESTAPSSPGNEHVAVTEGRKSPLLIDASMKSIHPISSPSNISVERIISNGPNDAHYLTEQLRYAYSQVGCSVYVLCVMYLEDLLMPVA